MDFGGTPFFWPLLVCTQLTDFYSLAYFSFQFPRQDLSFLKRVNLRRVLQSQDPDNDKIIDFLLL